MELTHAPILRDLPDELIGPRVLIRPVRSGDGAVIFEAVEESREQIAPWLPWVEKTQIVDDSEEYARRAAALWLTREELAVGIWDHATGQFLGGSGLIRINWAVPAFEIGYWLRTSAWGQGYITETVQALCEFAFETLGANRVEIRCDPRNSRSRAVPQRLGFVLEATLRNQVRDGAGELRDTLIFALTPDDYAQAKRLWRKANLAAT
jgi:RimJ/RimL family protein N-acetyltransferase